MHGQQTPVPVTGILGLVTLAKPDSLPEGASPRVYDMDFDVGGAKTRGGLTNVYAQVDSEVGPNTPSAAASDTWTSPSSIVSSGYTSFSPASDANSLDLTTYAFSLPEGDQISGILATLQGYSNVPASIMVQLLVAGSLVGTAKTVAMPQVAGTVTLGSTSDLWGTFITAAQVNGLSFGLRVQAISSGFDGATVFLNGAAITLGISTGTANFQYITTFTDQKGTVRNLSLDANGNFWVENVSLNPGELVLSRSGIARNALAVSAQGAGVQYFAFGDGFKGIDMPLQYTPNWTDRITQVGPGRAPTFTPITTSDTDYPIVDITQPASHTQGFSRYLQSQGPGSTSAGNVVTFYYLDSTVVPSPDTDLVDAFNSGNPVYVYAEFVGGGGGIGDVNFGPAVVLVTSVGLGYPPGIGRQFWYFTFNVQSIAYNYTNTSSISNVANYQRTLATLTTSEPVPNLIVGSLMTVSGNSVTAWNSQWRVTQTPNSSQMAITGSQVTSGVATLNYSVTGGAAAPAAGQLVTITNTLNAGGSLNVANASIVSSTGGSTGSFTINVSSADFAFEAESGLATTAGTIFDFDPGAGWAAGDPSPIYGTGTGGDLVFNATGLFIDPGTYRGTMGYITRNGLWTFPAAPVVFTVPENTTNLQVSDMLTGPEDVVGRYIAITEAGQNGVPGANFFVIPTPVDFYSQNVKYTATATVVNDNISNSVTLFFTGPVLYNSESIDQYGYNLFNNIEIGDPGWTIGYGGRQWYGLCINKLQNFVNLSFDGGPPSGTPPGWTVPDSYGSVVNSPKFGNSYYISNSSADTLTQAGLISQTAYQDANGVPIIQPNTTYSVRVTASNPSGVNGGSLVIALVNAGVILGSYSIDTTTLTTDLEIYSGTLLTTSLNTVPSGTTLEVYAENLVVGADVLLDRFDVYPTEIPVLTTTVYGSYVGLPEQVDAITGQVVFSSENQQPVNGAMVLYDTFYGLKAWSGKTPGSSLYSLQKSSDLEPAQWDEPEVAQRSGGAIGPMAFDLGEQWFLGASRAGLYLFVGGQPGKITQEIWQVWDAINWRYGQTIWVKVDTNERKIYIGVPMATPNFWLPNADANANPTSPNVMLVCNFQGIDTGEELRGTPEMHTTMFGNLNAVDMRRKWSIWKIPAPYANFVQASDDVQFYICNGRGNSKVYKLDTAAETDDGITIDSLYTTAGLPDPGKRQNMPQLGRNRVRWGYMVATLESSGNIQCKLYANRLPGPTTPGISSWQLPGGFSPGKPYNDDAEASMNFAGTRTYVELRENDGHGFSVSNIVIYGEADKWNPMRGRTGA